MSSTSVSESTFWKGVVRHVSQFSQADARLFGAATSTIDSRRLRLASYNIQTGIDTSHYRHYVTRSWKHLLPHAQRMENLDRIAQMLKQFDVVGLQEVDGGSLRSGFVDQTRYLADKAGFHHGYHQTNRNMGKLAQHSNGILSRFAPSNITEHKLPGLPGRGAMLAEFGSDPSALRICVLHLALSRRARQRQIGFVHELIQDYPNAVVMGDWNCHADSPEMQSLIRGGHLREPARGLNTFPSWRPQKGLDHILVSSSLQVEHVRVLNYPLSDHLPIAMDILLPESLPLAA